MTTAAEKQEEQKKPSDDVRRPSDDFLMKYIVGRTERATMDNGRRVIVDVSDRTSRDYKPVLIDGGWYMVNKKRFTLDAYLPFDGGSQQSNKKKNKASKKKKQTKPV